MTIPDDWTISTVEQLCYFENNRRIPVSESERAKRPGDVPYYGANGLQGYIDSAIFNEDLILLAEDGGHYDDFADRPIAYRITGPAWVNNHAHVIRSRDPDFQDFLFYSLEHKDIRANIVGGTRGKLNLGQLKNIEIAHPVNVSESIAIAEIIHLADDAIRFRRQLINKLEMMREGLLTDLLTYGVDDNGNLCYERTLKKSPIGMIPANWEIMSGARVSNLITKGESPAWQGYSYLEEGIIFITSENVRDGFIDISNPKYISDAFHTKLSRSQLSPRDLLINLTGASIGRFCLFPNYILTGNISQNVAVFRTINNIIEPEFAALYLQSSIGKKALLAPLKNNARGSISLGDLGKLLFIVPPAEERAVIVESYLALQDRLNIERTKLEKLLHLKEGLMTDLLTGQNRVPGPSPADVEVVV